MKNINRVNSSSKGSNHNFFQPKLTVNKPDDVYEHEAENMADHVMRAPDQIRNENTFFKPAPTNVQRKVSANTIQKQSAPALPEFTVNNFNESFANFSAKYDVAGHVPSTGTLFITHGVHMNYPSSVTKSEQSTFEADFVKSIHDKWSKQHLLALVEPGFASYMCEVDVTAQVKADAKDANTVIDVVKPGDNKKRFRSRVTAVDKKEGSETTHKAKLDLRDPTTEENKKTDEADFIQQVGNFDFDSDVINADCKEDIEKIKSFIQAIPASTNPEECQYTLSYVGRASSEGNAAYNKKLSEKRIRAVEKEIGPLDHLCFSFDKTAGEEGATEDAKFRRVNVGVFLSNSHKAKTASQNVAAHEFGHMIGLGDEYIDEKPEVPGSKIKFFGDDPTHYDGVKNVVDETAADELLMQNSSGIMSMGNEVKRGHYVMFAAAIDKMTRPEIEKATGKTDAKWMVF